MTKTIHIILNAHIDPIWLWPWQAGVDEVLATCRSACDRLDAHPDIVFTRGEAWVYQQVERLDPALSKRMEEHIRAGRWEIVGGWWIQPDCNAPSGFALEHQIALGKAYFEEKFGEFPRIAYNVDSFGHAATLPGYMRAAGQDRYVMMRPQEHEKPLPARLFRWRGYEDGPEVVTYRIPDGYTTRTVEILNHLQASTTELPKGIEHTMCFVGVGDHGGGPTERQLAWLREHENAVDGWRLVFSSPSRFFDAVAGQTETLPLVTGELQMHAIGCFSVYRPVKTALRRAEHLLRQTELMPIPTENHAEIKKAWERVCFHQFHDTLGGTCLPSAYPAVLDQLGYAATIADEALVYGLRRQLTALPDDKMQRIVALNASDMPYDGYVEFEPWLEYHAWEPHWHLVDAQNQPVPFQFMQPESLVTEGITRILFKQQIAPGGLGVTRINRHGALPPVSPGVSVRLDEIRNTVGIACSNLSLGFPDAPSLSLPRLEAIPDPSDTWSHGLDRYLDGPITSPRWNAPCLGDRGPLMASLLQTGMLGQSRLQQEWRVYAGEQFVELRLQVHWLESQKVLKLTLPLPAPATTRMEGILGGWLERPNDGKEMPLRDAILLDAGDSAKLGIVCPDVYAADVTPERIRLTLLRSALMAYHDPHSGTALRSTISDQGAHEFRFRFFCGEKVTQDLLDQHAMMLQRPLVMADLTRGMTPRDQVSGPALALED